MDTSNTDALTKHIRRGYAVGKLQDFILNRITLQLPVQLSLEISSQYHQLIARGVVIMHRLCAKHLRGAIWRMYLTV